MSTVAFFPEVEALPSPSLQRVGWRRRLAFGLFLLINAMLFIRPGDIIAPDKSPPIFEILILACLAISLPEVMQQLEPRLLYTTPITVCVIGLLVAVGLSHLTHAYIGGAAKATSAFVRLLVYYLLIVALVNSTDRLTQFVRVIGWLALVLAALSILGYHGIISSEGVAPVTEYSVNRDGEEIATQRLCGPGIFNDPNDICMILVPGMVLWAWMGRGRLRRRAISLLAIGILGYALLLTKSRGGFLVLLAALTAFFVARVGWRRMLPLTCIALPILMLTFAGRQTNIDLSDHSDTAQMRIQLWSDAFVFLRESPLFGIGFDNFADRAELAAHNSFLHCYAELGLLGGTHFFAAFYLSVRGLYANGRRTWVADERLRRLRPHLLATVVGYVAGMLSLSRSYVVPTYLMLGLSVSYFRLAGVPASIQIQKLTPTLIARVMLASILFLIATYLFVRLTVRWN